MKLVKVLLVTLLIVVQPMSSVSAEPVKGSIHTKASPLEGEANKLPDLKALELMGSQLYLQGQSDKENNLKAVGAGNSPIKGAQASCVNCHRHSGLGGVEGNELILPITGRALFGGGDRVIVQVDKRFNKSLATSSQFYNEETFASAVRLGQSVSGRQLNSLMPRYDLSDLELKALAAYLRTLSVSWSPGVDEKEIHLATVITPDVSVEQRKVFIDMLNLMVKQHNVNVASGKRQRIPPIERRLHNRRHWKVDVWELKGPSSTWEAQLNTWQQQNPVFAMLSGMSQDEWQPVHHFCETNKVTCWFPSVDLVPETAKNGRYGLYFTEGISLEAEVIVNQVLNAEKKPKTIIQLIGPNALAKTAAAKAQQLFDKAGIKVQDIEWSQQMNEGTGEFFNKLQAQDVVISWLKPEEQNTVVATVSAPLAKVFLSSTLMGEAAPSWPKEWLTNTWLVQRLELPKMRAANLSRFHAWLNYWKLPLVDEKMQSEVFFAVNSFSWVLSSMLNNFYTDYLIDRAESTLSMREAMQVQEEVQSMMMGGGGRKPKSEKVPTEPSAAERANTADKLHSLMKRESTTAYPRIGLGNGQRFASKGAYIRKLTNDQDGEVAKWIVP